MASNRLRNLWYRIVYYLIFVFIYFVRNAGSNVLVHCRMGISRSASTVTWLLQCYPRIDTPTLNVTWFPLLSTFRGTGLVRWGDISEYVEASFETGLNGKITEINAFFCRFRLLRTVWRSMAGLWGIPWNMSKLEEALFNQIKDFGNSL